MTFKLIVTMIPNQQKNIIQILHKYCEHVMKIFGKKVYLTFYGNTCIYFLDIFPEHFEENIYEIFIEHFLKCKFIAYTLLTFMLT